MTVQELINILETIENKDMRINLSVDAELIGIVDVNVGRDEWNYSDVAIIKAKA